MGHDIVSINGRNGSGTITSSVVSEMHVVAFSVGVQLYSIFAVIGASID